MTAFLLAALGLAWAGSAAEPPGKTPSYQKNKLKGVIIPFYQGSPPQLAARFRVERVFTDYQRKGFFRIGVLPFLVAEGVSIEVRNTETMGEALEKLRGWAEVGKGRKLAEMRNVTFSFFGDEDKGLQATRVQLENDGQWAMTGVQFRLGKEIKTIGAARMQVSGADAGMIRWEADGTPVSRNVLSDHAFARAVSKGDSP